ncbi:hypothetical protein EVB54_006 [Rhizobium phage RHph_Y67]|nr:hypothetical protein EVB54_006 [Rhizobium phage RHph_Y67]
MAELAGKMDEGLTLALRLRLRRDIGRPTRKPLRRIQPIEGSRQITEIHEIVPVGLIPIHGRVERSKRKTSNGSSGHTETTDLPIEVSPLLDRREGIVTPSPTGRRD